MARVLVTRPQPLADETAARLASLGHHVIVAPLLEPAALDWIPPDEPVEALLFTSPQAPRFAGPVGRPFQLMPVFAVGDRTAEAAREAGFGNVRTAGGDVAGLLASVVGRHRRVLHLAGLDRTPAEVPAGLEVVVRTVYEARLATLPAFAEAALRASEIDWALLFSSRTAAHFGAIYDRLGVSRTALAVAAISPAALDAAGAGWRQAVAAVMPNEAAILAASGLSCDKATPAGDEER